MATCGACNQEKTHRTSCISQPVKLKGGRVVDPLRVGTEKPPVLGEPIDTSGIHMAHQIPDWQVPGDTEPKLGLVRLVLCQEKRRDLGKGRHHTNVQNLWTYFAWETPEEAEVHKAALIAEHGYHTRGSEDPAVLDKGVLIIEEPFCGSCTAPIGGFHHVGCGNEKCPQCKWQIISCGCLDEHGPADDDEFVLMDDEPDESEPMEGSDGHPIIATPVIIAGPNVITLFPKPDAGLKGKPRTDVAALQRAPVPDDYAGFYEPPVLE